MSLTSHLKQRESPIRRFLVERFPNVRAAIQAQRDIRLPETIRPSGPVPWGTIGTAITYRLAYYVTEPNPKTLPAWEGAHTIFDLDGQDNFLLPLGLALFESLGREVQRLQPLRRRLDRPDEELLARYCFGLALFDELYHEGRAVKQRSSLYLPQPITRVADLLAAVAEPAVDDLCRLSWAFHDQCADSFPERAVAFPTFDGSRDIGGADGDLILDGCLVECKTTVQQPAIDGRVLYQLLGYVLLDYSDHYRIHEVGLYLARQHILLRWLLDSLMRSMAGGELPSLPELRTQFGQVARETKSQRTLRLT